MTFHSKPPDKQVAAISNPKKKIFQSILEAKLALRLRHFSSKGMAPILRTLSDRSDFFWSKVIILPNGCWRWMGAKSRGGASSRFHRNVYASMRVLPKGDSVSRTIRVHRWAYARFRRPIPTNKDLDHLCNYSLCVNPWHLQPTTKKKNSQRACAVRYHSDLQELRIA